ncbi:hypothetical protein PHJA_002573200 [Phtheirospermum japonicum]|uniref:S-protein homolog n=1 Tax=Phtheirospermum japonicum TaxID=374723 RepID=A0A830D0X9_9LAMI|nr:hypothetical protein PHJA_002573200 [Phtheirospermum japonicum]
MNFWGTTLYFCRFRWESKEQAFEIFNSDITKACDDHTCEWVVKQNEISLTSLETSIDIKHYW